MAKKEPQKRRDPLWGNGKDTGVGDARLVYMVGLMQVGNF